MENDDKIMSVQNGTEASSRKAEVRLFLHEELLPLEKSKQVSSYDLVAEYAKTRKNKSPFVWLLLACCFVVVVLITVFAIMYLSRENKKIEVSSNVFNDLDMRSLLDTKSHTEMNYLVALNTSGRLENERDYRLKQAALDRDSELYLIDSMRLESGSDEQKAAVLSRYRKQLAAIHAQYDEQIKAAVAETDVNRQKLDSLNKSGTESADFSDQVRQHERSLLVSSYTDNISQLQSVLGMYQKNDFAAQRAAVGRIAGKYQKEVDSLDPVLSDTRADEIVGSMEHLPAGSYDIPGYLASLPQNVLTNDFISGMKSVQRLLGDYQYLHAAVTSIPQKHSLPDYKKSEARIVYRIGLEAGRAVSAQISNLNDTKIRLESQNAELEKQGKELLAQRDAVQQQYDATVKRYDALEQLYNGVSGDNAMFDAWFEKQAADSKASGFILDVSDPGQIKAFVVKKIRMTLPSDGSSVAVNVYHGKWQKIPGTIFLKNGTCFFTVDDPSDVSRIAAGDRFIR
jgi:hypothetical protein